jgi:hypothetical protein
MGFRFGVFSRTGFSLRGDNCTGPDYFATVAAFVDCFSCNLLGMLGTSVGRGVAAPGLTFDFAAVGATDT